MTTNPSILFGAVGDQWACTAPKMDTRGIALELRRLPAVPLWSLPGRFCFHLEAFFDSCERCGASLGPPKILGITLVIPNVRFCVDERLTSEEHIVR